MSFICEIPQESKHIYIELVTGYHETELFDHFFWLMISKRRRRRRRER